MAAFTFKEYFDMIMLMGKHDRNGRRAAQQYAQLYPERRHPTFDTFYKLAHRLEMTGSFKPKPATDRPRTATNEAHETDVLACVSENPHTSTRAISAAAGISTSSVWRILHRQTYHPYHAHIHQDLRDSDFQKRLDYCNSMLNIMEDNPENLNNIMWSDEANFSNTGTVNIHNAHYWATKNPRWLIPQPQQGWWSLNVWCAVLGNSVVGPVFIEGPLTGEKYRRILETHVQVHMERHPDYWFQQDGASPHYATHVRAWLAAHLPHRWIGRGGPIAWPPRSPDLSPLDYFFWGYLKDTVYNTPPSTRENMKERIREACENLTPEQFEAVRRDMSKRLHTCIVVEGQHFEHVL